jgi:branched-chain amino acid transport system permease protein
MNGGSDLASAALPRPSMRQPQAAFLIVILLLFGVTLLATHVVTNPYFFFAGYVVIQYVALATAWNVLGGYAGYINFGPAAFFGAGAYVGAFLVNTVALPLPLSIAAAGIFGAVLGLLMGWMTLRVQGVYFAIATIGLVVVAETLVTNIDALGGASGMAVRAPDAPFWAGGNTQYAFIAIVAIALLFVVLARWIEGSAFGRGLRALKASEIAAECAGVPTLRLKLVTCALSGGMLAAAGAPYSYYSGFIEPGSAFSLSLSLNAIAMPLIGGKRTWIGPVIGALLLASTQQIASVTISSELNILVVGIVLVIFVAAAPDGLVGAFGPKRRTAR